MRLNRKWSLGAKGAEGQNCRDCKGLSRGATLDPRHHAFFDPLGKYQLIKGPRRLGTDFGMDWHCPGSLLSVDNYLKKSSRV